MTDVNLDISVGLADEDVAPLAGRLPRFLRHRLVTRLVWSLLTLVGVSILVFIVLRVVPGNQINAAFGTEAGALTSAQRKALLHGAPRSDVP